MDGDGDLVACEECLGGSVVPASADDRFVVEEGSKAA